MSTSQFQKLYSQEFHPEFFQDTSYLKDIALCGISPEYLKKLDLSDTLYQPKTLPLGFPAYAIINCGKYRVYYEDLILSNPQVGFADATNGTARRNTLCAVLNYVQSVFDFSNISASNPIRLHVNESYAPIVNPAINTNILAFAGPFFANASVPGIIKGYVCDYVTTGVDPALANQYHAELTVNFHQINSPVPNTPIQWQSDHTLLPISICYYDLFSVLLHEITHTLGWISYIQANANGEPQSLIGNNQFSGIDQFLHIGNNVAPLSLNPLLNGAPTNPIINPLFANNSTALLGNNTWINSLPAPNNDPVYSGSLTTSAFLSIPSLLSHLDDQLLEYTIRGRISPGNSKNYVIAPFIAKGVLRRSYEDIEINTLSNLGYSIHPSFSSTTLSNSPPYSTRMASYVNYYTLDFPESVPADFPPITNNLTANLVINLAADPTLVDAEGDPIFVYPGSLVNIRGCGIGGNNHNSLTITTTPNGDIITYTPRANFYGRAQFGFRLFDGKEEGSYVIYTIDVLRGNQVNCPPGTNIVLNGDFEEGSEVRMLGADEMIEASNTEQFFLKEGKLRQGAHLGDCHPYNYLSNNWWPSGAGDLIKNSYLNCNSATYTSIAGRPTTSFPFGGTAPNPSPANGLGDRYKNLASYWNLFNLCSDMEVCRKYVLEFDYFAKPFYFQTGTNVPLTVGFTNSPSYPAVPTLLYEFTHNISVVPNSWQHVAIPFVYCGNTQAGILSLIQTVSGFGFLIDNVDLKADLTPPLPLELTITPVNTVICQGNNVQINTIISNALCNTSYTWAPTTGLSCTNCPNPIASPSQTTTYTLTVSTECASISAETTINVVNNTPICCGPTTLSIPDGAVSATIGLIPAGSIIEVIGLFTVNSNLTLTNCTLRMAPNAKIDVLAGNNLSIAGSTLFSCSSMWDGIYCQSGSNVNISSSRIEDALYGIYSVQGGNYQLFNNIFNKNNISIFVDDYSAPHPGQVFGCIFECTASGSPTPGSVLKVPMANQISHFGISCRNNSLITFGAISTQPNIFRNIEIGIFAIGSKINLYRNNFNNIVEPFCANTIPNNPICPIVGWPIWVQGTILTVGDASGSSHENNFNNCSNGIFIDGKSGFNIQKNNFVNIVTSGFFGNYIYSKCIFAQQNTNQLLTGLIQDNVFINFEAGVYYMANKMRTFDVLGNKMSNFNSNNGSAIYLLQNQTHPIQIKYNTINELATQTGVYGIRVQSAVSVMGGVDIAENSIKNIRHGIWITNYQSINIRNHSTSFNASGNQPAGIYYSNTVPLSLSVGIKAENCPKIRIVNNLIRKPLPLPSSDYTKKLFGISVETNSIGATIQENEVRRLGKGLHFYGTPNGPLKVTCNKIYDNRRGVAFLSTYIGNQGIPNPSGAAQDNQWSIPGNYSTDWLGAERDLSSPSSIWYSRSSSLPFFPHQLLQMNPTSAIGGVSVAGAPYNCSFGCAHPPCYHLWVRNVITRTAPFDSMSAEGREMTDIEIYDLLMNDSSYTQTGTMDDSLFLAYRDSLASTNIGRLFDFTNKLEAGDTAGAYAALTAISPTTCPEISRYIVYEIFQKTWARNLFEFEPEDSLALYQVAFQKPHLCGTAVYDARVMLGLDVDDFDDPELRRQNAVDSEITINDDNGNFKGVLYPNPAQNEVKFTATLNDSETLALILYDLSGRILLSRNFSGNVNEVIDIRQLSAGIYLFKITINQQEVQTGKLIVN